MAVKAVTNAEEYLADHFPSFPVLPGVMMLETLAQAARQLIAGLDEKPNRPLVIRDVKNLRYANMVRPGQLLKVEVSIRTPADLSSDDPVYAFTGKGFVIDHAADASEEAVAVQGRFTMGLISTSNEAKDVLQTTTV